MPQIKFSKMYFKLNNPIFTTIRKYEDDRFSFYKERINDIFDIKVKDEIIGKAKLIDIEVTDFFNLPISFLRIDTNLIDINEIYNLFESLGINKNDRIIILTLEQLNEIIL